MLQLISFLCDYSGLGSQETNWQSLLQHRLSQHRQICISIWKQKHPTMSLSTRISVRQKMREHRLDLCSQNGSICIMIRTCLKELFLGRLSRYEYHYIFQNGLDIFRVILSLVRKNESLAQATWRSCRRNLNSAVTPWNILHEAVTFLSLIKLP